MSLKALFSELYVHRNDLPEKYKNLPAFEELSSKPEVVEKVDLFGLPEVIKLICCSPKLMACSFAEKYKSIQPLYCAEKIDSAMIVQKFYKIDVFESEILKHADISILKALDDYFIDAENYRDNLDSHVKKSIESIQNAQQQSGTDLSLLQRMKDSVEQEKRELARVRSFLTRKKPIIEKIRQYEKDSEEEIVEKRREQAYKVLAHLDRKNEVDEMLQQIVETGVVNQIQASQFKNPNFLISLLFYLSKEENKRKAIEILLKLYDIGVIDLNESPTYDFIAGNSDLLLDYLLGIPHDKIEDIENETLNELVDITIRLEDETKLNSTCAKFYTFWNTLTKEFEWEWIFEKIVTFYPDRFTEIAAILIRGLKGRASRAYVSVLFAINDSGHSVAFAEVFSNALASADCNVTDSIINAIRLLERNNRTTQVKLNTAERTLNSQSQELFSSMYIPLEHLEELAINLSVTSGQIDAALVGNQLRDGVADLRGALEIFGVKPVVDIDNWKNLENIEFDSTHHTLVEKSADLPNKVLGKTLGFSYIDDEGNAKERLARVFAPDAKIIASETPPKKATNKEHQQKSTPRKGTKPTARRKRSSHSYTRKPRRR